jgi:hypothetical protein
LVASALFADPRLSLLRLRLVHQRITFNSVNYLAHHLSILKCTSIFSSPSSFAQRSRFVADLRARLLLPYSTGADTSAPQSLQIMAQADIESYEISCKLPEVGKGALIKRYPFNLRLSEKYKIAEVSTLFCSVIP